MSRLGRAAAATVAGPGAALLCALAVSVVVDLAAPPAALPEYHAVHSEALLGATADDALRSALETEAVLWSYLTPAILGALAGNAAVVTALLWSQRLWQRRRLAWACGGGLVLGLTAAALTESPMQSGDGLRTGLQDCLILTAAVATGFAVDLLLLAPSNRAGSSA